MVTKKEYESASETDEEPEPVKEKTPKKVEKVLKTYVYEKGVNFFFLRSRPLQPRRPNWLHQELNPSQELWAFSKRSDFTNKCLKKICDLEALNQFQHSCDFN
jgi:hypothetical protein